MKAIRRANPTSARWREKLTNLSSDRIAVDETYSTTENSYVDGNPHYGQEIIRVNFTYTIDTRNEKRPIRMSLYYRTSSNLFILLPGPRDNLLSEAIREVKKGLIEDLRILPSISVTKKGIWRFISAGQYHYLKIRIHGDEYDIQDNSELEEVRNIVEGELEKKAVVLEASLSFRDSDRDRSITTEYKNDSLILPNGSNGGPPDFETFPELTRDAIFVIQKFEKEALLE